MTAGHPLEHERRGAPASRRFALALALAVAAWAALDHLSPIFRA